MVVHASNPRILEAEAGGSQVHRQGGLHVAKCSRLALGYMGEALSLHKKKKKKKWGKGAHGQCPVGFAVVCLPTLHKPGTTRKREYQLKGLHLIGHWAILEGQVFD